MLRAALALLVACAPAAVAVAAPAQAAMSLVRVGSFAQPVYAIGAPGDASRLMVVEKAGRIQMVKGATTTLFMDISDRVRSIDEEQGLLSMAFAPDYAASGKFYVYYTTPGGSESDLVISEFQRSDPDHGNKATERVVLRIPHRLADNHNGGQLQTGPDGKLWIGTGDGGGGNDTYGNAQKTDPSWNDVALERDARLGKLLRIDPAAGNGCDPGGDCTIPADNPGFAQREIWSYGLRNPWRFSFDRATGDLLIGDVGQAAWEEVDLRTGTAPGKGINFGWPYFEGAHPGPLGGPPAGCCAAPVLEYSHNGGGSSIVGGYVVRDPALPDLEGRYLYGDTIIGPDIRAVTLAPGGATDDVRTGLSVTTLSSFGQDACGRVYAVSLDGPVYRLAQTGACILPPGTLPPAPGEPGPPAAGGPATAGGGAGTTAADVTAPVLTLRAASRQRPWRTGIVRVRVSCDEACTLRVRGAFAIIRPARAAKLTLRTATGRAALTQAGSATVALKVSVRTRAALARALRRDRRVTVRFAVSAQDAAGNVRTASARSRITRR